MKFIYMIRRSRNAAFACLSLCLLASGQVFASDITSKINIYIEDMAVEAKGQLEMIKNDLPRVESCIRQVFPATLRTGVVTDGWNFDERFRYRQFRYNSSSKVCSIKYLMSYAESKQNYYGYRDVTTVLNLDSDANVSFGADFGLGLFGPLLSTITLGISDLLIETANNVKGQLEAGVSRALSKRVPVQDIVTPLTLILCEAEAANLAKMACENSKVVDQSAHVKKVRERYEEFISSF